MTDDTVVMVVAGGFALFVWFWHSLEKQLSHISRQLGGHQSNAAREHRSEDD